VLSGLGNKRGHAPNRQDGPGRRDEGHAGAKNLKPEKCPRRQGVAYVGKEGPLRQGPKFVTIQPGACRTRTPRASSARRKLALMKFIRYSLQSSITFPPRPGDRFLNSRQAAAAGGALRASFLSLKKGGTIRRAAGLDVFDVEPAWPPRASELRKQRWTTLVLTPHLGLRGDAETIAPISGRQSS